jgi:hypothetical protein
MSNYNGLGYGGSGLGYSPLGASGFNPSDPFQDINSCGRNPQAYINSIISRGMPIGPPPFSPYGPLGGAHYPLPPDSYMNQLGREGRREENTFGLSSNSVINLFIYALAAVGLWKLGLGRLIKEAFSKHHQTRNHDDS